MPRHALHVMVIGFVLSVSFAFAGNAQDAAPKKPAVSATNNAKPQPANAGAAPGNPQQGGARAKPEAASAAALQAGIAPAATPSGDSQSEGTEALKPKKMVWAFSGMRGHVDKQAAQRGFQVYSQVCAACHGMNFVAYRDLSRIGFSAEEIKAIAAQKQVSDLDDNGQPIQRPAKPFDHFVPPFPNDKAAQAANNGSYPPDLSLIVKAREQGADYVYSILTGFREAPANETPVANKSYNPYFQGHWISMPPPLMEGAVSYQDGTTASIDQMARDVVTFLQWAAEPEMEARHEMGLKVLIFLAIMAGFLYAAKKRVWSRLKQ